MGTLFVDKLDPQSGTSLELGSSGDTVAVNTGATTNLAGNVTLGANGKTITVPAGATITNNGTQTGFGGDNTPSFSAFLSSNQTISNETYTKVQFNTENYDTDNAYDNSSNYRFTIPSGKGGNYFISSNLRFQSFSGGEIRLVVRVNGVDKGYFSTDVASNIFTVTSANFIKNFSASDYIEIFAWQNSGGNLYVQGASGEYLLSTFSAMRVITWVI